MFFSRENQGKAPGAKMVTSVLGESLHLTGDISFAGKTRIDGTVEGKILGEFLILGETGVIDGEVSAESLICSGRVTGSIVVKKLAITSSGVVEGRVETMDLEVESGAVLNGEIAFRSQELRLVPGSQDSERLIDHEAVESKGRKRIAG